MQHLCRHILLLASALTLWLAGTGHAQSILISSNSGSALAGLFTNQSYSYNFGITTLGGSQSLELTNIGIFLDRGNNTTQPFQVAIYGGLGASGPLLTNFTVAATNVRSQMSLFNLLFQGSLSLTNGNYSLTLSSSAASGGSTQYTVRQGTISLLDSNNATLPLTYWVQDNNATGTAGTNFQANFVLADYQVNTSIINYGNYRLGANLSTTVTLTNTAIFATNASGGVVSERLAAAAFTTNAATISGLGTNSLPVSGTTNFNVGLDSANVGTNSGAVTLTYNSVSNGTASVRPASLGTNPVGVGSQEITVTGVGYRLAEEALSATNVNLGRFHIGASNLATSLGLTNTAVADGFSEGLLVADDGTTGGATVGDLTGGLLGAGASTNLTVGLAGVSAVGVNSGSVTLGFQSSGAGTSGLAATNLGSQVINVIAQGYSGQAVWNVDADGAWGNYGSWNEPGGTPGIDGVLSTNDTATFGGAISTARTVSLSGQNPVLTTMTFSNAEASYTVTPDAGGDAITIGTAQGAGLITNAAGTHTVAAALALARATEVGVNGAALLRFTGGISGQKDLTKTGSGVLLVEGLNSLTGITRVAAGDMVVNGSLPASGVVIDDGAALWGRGTVGAISGAGSVNPATARGFSRPRRWIRRAD